MNTRQTSIWVYLDWAGMPGPSCIGVLNAEQAKGKRAFGFEYDPQWLRSEPQRLLDPDLAWYTGRQFPGGKENFGLFLDSMPDTWGRTLMKRRAVQVAQEKGEIPPKLHEIDFLLGVHDVCRMGALRLKLAKDGPFLANNSAKPVPLWSTMRELQHAAHQLETGHDAKEEQKWLDVLVAPGSSLGGARPKANVLAENGQMWIAKFPSHHDEVDKAAWEFLAYRLAVDAGVTMSPCRLEKVSGHHRTFFTQRFDRVGGERIHFASAMTMTGHSEDTVRDKLPSYLELAEFIQSQGAQNRPDLHQLWRRIVFNVAISNTDDHLRNHGFILGPRGWALSPAYDLNPSIDKDGLALLIDENDNALDIGLVKSVGEYFQLTGTEMSTIIAEVKASVGQWQAVATELGILRAEKELMRGAFRLG